MENKVWQVLRINLKMSDGTKHWDRTIDLKFLKFEDAKECSEKLLKNINDNSAFVHFGPDDSRTKQIILPKSDIDEVNTEIIRDFDEKEAECADIIEDIKKRVKRLEDKEDCIRITPYVPYIPPCNPYPIPLIATYMVSFPSDNITWQWTASTITSGDDCANRTSTNVYIGSKDRGDMLK
jgi:hypothetical protein